MKVNKEDLRDLVARIQIKLTLLWDDSKSKIKSMETEAIKSKSNFLLKPSDDGEYQVVRNVLTLIKKLEDEFNLTLE